MVDIVKVTKNLACLIFGGVLARFAFYVVDVLLARRMGQEFFGIFSTALAFSTFLIFITDFGMKWKIVKDGSREPAIISELLGTVTLLKVGFFLICYPFMLSLLGVLGYNTLSIQFFSIFWIFILPMAIQESLAAGYQAKQKMEINAFYQGITPVFVLVLIYFFTNPPVELNSIAWMFVFGVGFVTLIWLIHTWFVVSPKVNISSVGSIIKGSYLFGLSDLLAIIFFRIDTIMLSIFKDMTAVGAYSVSYKMLEIVYKIPVIFSVVMMPILFASSKQNKALYFKIYETIFRVSLPLGLIISALVYLTSDQIISVLFGAKFSSSIIILKILSVCFVIKFVSITSEMILTTLDKQALKTGFQGIAATINIFLNLFLIPRYGVIGAAIATVISELLLFIFYFVSVQKEHHSLKIGKVLFAPVIFMSGLMVGVSYLPGNLIFKSVLLSTVFIGVLLHQKYFTDEEIRSFLSLTRKIFQK